MARTVVDSTKGLTVEAGSGFSIESELSLDSGITMTATALKKDTTLTRGGLYTLSGSSLITVTLPKAANVPGALFILRAASTGAHVVTASQEVSQLHLNYITFPLTGAANSGSKVSSGNKITFSSQTGITGSSVVLMCDGKSFCLMAASGSHDMSR